MSDYSKLRRLAHDASETEMGWFVRGDLASVMADDWAEYVAALEPEVILALIAENERLSGECEGCPMSIAEEVRIERDQLKAENEALREDHDKAWRLAGMNLENLSAALAENERLRKQIDDMSPLKGAPLTGPDLKCLACGGYHYGMSGLPCPKMAPMAQGAVDD